MKKVLLNWPTDRKDLLKPFIELSSNINFCVVWDKPSDGSFKKNHPFDEVHFCDFKTPYHLLNSVKPDKILFFDLNSFPEISLNIAAKNTGITTYSMHHGVYMSNEIDLALDKEKSEPPQTLINSFSSLYFYLSSFRLKNIPELISFLYFPIVRKRRHRLVALQKVNFELRKPHYFIQLSSHNAIITKKINSLQSDDRLIYIGHPFFDEYFSKTIEKKESAQSFYLLIDFPNIESNIAFQSVTAKGKKEFYKRLSGFAKRQGKRLKVKLHPYGFDSEHNYEDDNIDLIKETDMMSLIHQSSACFAFYSSLIIPICYYKPCVIFNMGLDFPLQVELANLGACKMVNFFNFNYSDIDIDSLDFNKENKSEFVDRYLYKADGQSTQRLKSILEK